MEAAVMKATVPPSLTEAEEDRYPRISEKFLRNLLRSDMRVYYSTKELNDKLYLHFKGFRRIENLHPFTGLRVLYIEGNCISEIEGLEQCVELRCLFLQENAIKEIRGLDTLVNLDTLNLSDNCLTRISGLENLTRLSSLLLARNQIGAQGVSDLENLRNLRNLSVLDLTKNKCSDPAILPEILVNLPELRVLYLTNNEIVKNLENYRKRMVRDLLNLTFLDDRPVFPEDRRFVSAFYSGGIEAEREERKAFQREKEEERLRNHLAFQAMMDEARARRPHREEDSGSVSTTLPTPIPSSDEEAKSLDAASSGSEALQASSSSETEDHRSQDVLEEVKFEARTPVFETEVPAVPSILKLQPTKEEDVPPLETPSAPTFTIEEVVDKREETSGDLYALD